MRFWPRRYLTCSACGRQGKRWKFDTGHGSLPVCRNRDLCASGSRFRRAVAAMPSAQEEHAMVLAQRAAAVAGVIRRSGMEPESSATYRKLMADAKAALEQTASL